MMTVTAKMHFLDPAHTGGPVADLDLRTLDYEPDGRELADFLQAQKEWKEQNPNYNMEDAADYYAELQGEIERGK